jgi:hypothetical protein
VLIVGFAEAQMRVSERPAYTRVATMIRFWPRFWGSKFSRSILVCVSLLPHLLTLAAVSVAKEPAPRQTENVILVTMDGLRWQELFGGAERRLIHGDEGKVRDVEVLERRFWHDEPKVRRERLMPFFWQVVARRGQVFGSPDHNSLVRVTNGLFFSYPGYNELLSGRGDPRIDSNEKRANPNVTVLEWLNGLDHYRGRIVAFSSWDVFPFILNSERSGIAVSAGWQPLPGVTQSPELEQLHQLATELPPIWPGVRFDVFTFRAALEYLTSHKPRVLYVAFDETDDWAHEGRYDLYLDAAHRNDRYIGQLWEAAQTIEQYAEKTSLVLTTDHGRGDIRDGWKSHGREIPGSERIWIAVLGPDTEPLGLRADTEATQSQVAASVAALLGEDFLRAAAPNSAPPLPGICGLAHSP